ncbi:GntP family permease [Micrococcus sp.]|uniref:GntP family permease n=1 Tax=Micrococcus sp. TaxID=1271 RepID=UPI0026DCFF4B|nr:GntP family permease [Micrococcus sp.]MDO4240707.1 GntP family permease [Micrococcus sp.]
MTLEEWTPVLGAGPLLGIALAAILLLLFLIMYVRMHAFVALVLVSLVTAFAAGIPAGLVVPAMTKGFGSTLASVALLVGLGAMLGRVVEVSGGAKALADTLIRVFGERRAPFALGVASLLFGFPIFFDAGLVVMLPVIFAVARRLGGSVLAYGLPAAGAFSVMHIYVPPHPGPVTAAELFGANVGLVMLLGLLIAVPTWYVTSYLFGLWAGRRWTLPVPAILGRADEEREANPPAFGLVVAVLVLPMLLILMNTGLNTLNTAGAFGGDVSDQGWYQVLRALGETPVALLITLLVATFTLGRRAEGGRDGLEKILDGALGPVCSVILVTGAGGMFGGVLRTSGIGDALADSLTGMGVPLILAGFLIAGALRIAQGSATVALTTAAGLLSAAVASAGYTELQVATMVIAVAAGSVIASHVNDSGFWLVGRFFGMDVKTTLKTWTVLETLIGVMGFALAWAVFGVAGALA